MPVLRFPDYPEFRPNLTPRDIFRRGSFGGTYWRPIESRVTGKRYRNMHFKYPAQWWHGIPANQMVQPWDQYDVEVNMYKVRVGTTLEEWEDAGWIHASHPYGWVQWYCDFYAGHRGPDDARQIKRWVHTAGPKSRFRQRLIRLIREKNADYTDVSISPKIRQTLQHWGYVLTQSDIGAIGYRSNR